MGEVVERIALSIASADAEQMHWGRKIMPLEVARALARAALEALREPTEEMCQAGYDAMDANDKPCLNADVCWPAMIDAALAEPSSSGEG